MILKWLFGLHPKNKGKSYIQGWYCFNPSHNKRKWIRRIYESICWIISRHEISKTEWSYGGGEFVDCHCRWCDKALPITKEEARFMFKTWNEWGRHEVINPPEKSE